MTGKGLRRSQLLHEAERLYTDRPWSDIELAERLGVDRTTIYKTRRFMEEELGLFFIEENRGRYRLDPQHRLANIRLTPTEALALYLGGRRLQQQTRTGQKPVATALEKLARALRQPMMANLTQAAQDILEQEQDPRQVAVMEILVEGWITGRKVRIRYKKPHENPRQFIVSPYQLEPAVWGDGVYLIGHSEQHNGLTTFKIARIEHAAVTMDPFTIPEDFDSRPLLKHAWGIWNADHPPQTVRLRFTRHVTPRVKESIWHPSQTIQDLPDGGCIWEAQIAEIREMEPWVRGWGADVEVLGPAILKEGIVNHIRRLSRQYGLSTDRDGPRDPLLRLWGKTVDGSIDPEQFHPAVYHMLDVGHVAQQLLSEHASPRWRWVLGRAFNTDPDTLHEWLPWFVALHDIGKISTPFQALNNDQRVRLEKEGADFGNYQPLLRDLHHPIMGHMVMREWAKSFPHHWGTAFLDTISGHHGRYRSPEGTEYRLLADLREPPQWEEWREQACSLLHQHFVHKEPEAWPQPDNVSAAIATLNGFTILCDWLGSDSDYFAADSDTPLAAYTAISQRQARQRVEDAGFFVPVSSAAPVTFGQLFYDFDQIRPLQRAIDDIPGTLLAQPTLTIIEAPTGEGKTEAALALAHRIAADRGSDELYIALPTTATSNAMFMRIQEHLRDRLELAPQAVQLVHGQAFLVQDDLRITPLDNGQKEAHPALRWLEPKKKALLSPFGVGTVDQAELAALNVSHNALRLIGLAGKVVILDEVHAYDTYMTTIIERMLQWLAALGSSVILLSATLPGPRRHQLAAAYSGTVPTLSKGEGYPYLLVTGSESIYETNPPAVQQMKTIDLGLLHFTDMDATGKAQWLLAQVADGGCICWITNLVDRAQKLFAALANIAPDNVDLTLLHAQFPLDQRQMMESDIMQKYGKPGLAVSRPLKGIVIGTQVLEQSLDLDFDMMVTDLAPVDLMLQRFGRLHRHDRGNRSAAHPRARAFINYEVDEAGGLILGHDRFYGPYLLLRSREVIDQRAFDPGRLILPKDYRPLVDTVYDETPPAPDHSWHEAWEQQNNDNFRFKNEAKLRLAGEPLSDEPFHKGGHGLKFEEDEDGFGWIVAQTRFQERPTITVIPIIRRDNRTGYLEATGDIPLDQPADRDRQLALLRRSLRLSHLRAVARIKTTTRGALFDQSPLLRRIWPLWLRPDGTAEDADLHLDPKLGLVVGTQQPHEGGENG